MSEYIMSHTGTQLDEAISKVLDGYVLPSEIINIFSNVSDMDITNGKILNVNVPPSIPNGFIKPTGNLTDGLISRSSYIDANTGSGQHKATIPAGYYVDSALTIKEWSTGLIRSKTGSTGASLNVPPNVIGFTPVYVLLVALGINSDNAANTVIAAYGNNASAYSAAYLYAGAKASLSKTYPINSTYNTININSSGITFVGLSGVKYASSFDYRWFAFR